MKNYRCFFFLYMGSTTWLAHDNWDLQNARKQASKQSKARRRRLGRRDASAIRRKPNRQLLSSKQPMGREARVSIYPCVCLLYIFGRVVGRVPGVGSAVRTSGSIPNHLNRGSEPDGHGSRRHRGVLESGLEPFTNRIGMDLGGTGGSGTGTGTFVRTGWGGSRSYTGFWNRKWHRLRTGCGGSRWHRGSGTF
jgi:hypothetical protein